MHRRVSATILLFAATCLDPRVGFAQGSDTLYLSVNQVQGKLDFGQAVSLKNGATALQTSCVEGGTIGQPGRSTHQELELRATSSTSTSSNVQSHSAYVKYSSFVASAYAGVGRTETNDRTSRKLSLRFRNRYGGGVTQKLGMHLTHEFEQEYKDHPRAFVQKCGDAFVWQMEQGASLAIDLDIEFASAERRQKFEAEFGASYAGFELGAAMSRLSSDLDESASVTVRAAQTPEGTSLANILGSSSATCLSSAFEVCKSIIDKAVEYARRDFATAATTCVASCTSAYLLAPYDAIAPVMGGVTGIDEYERQLYARRDSAIQAWRKGQWLLGMPAVPAKRRESLRQALDRLQTGVDKLVVSAFDCWYTPAQCSKALSETPPVPSPIDRQLFEPPSVDQICNQLRSDLPGSRPLHTMQILRERLDGAASGSRCGSKLQQSFLATTTLTGLGSKSLADLSPIIGLQRLRELSLERNEIRDVSALSFLDSLEVLDLHENNLRSVVPLEGLQRLEFLSVSRNPQLSDLSALKRLQNLTLLDVAGTPGAAHLSQKDFPNTSIYGLLPAPTLIAADIWPQGRPCAGVPAPECTAAKAKVMLDHTRYFDETGDTDSDPVAKTNRRQPHEVAIVNEGLPLFPAIVRLFAYSRVNANVDRQRPIRMIRHVLERERERPSYVDDMADTLAGVLTSVLLDAEAPGTPADLLEAGYTASTAMATLCMSPNNLSRLRVAWLGAWTLMSSEKSGNNPRLKYVWDSWRQNLNPNLPDPPGRCGGKKSSAPS